MLLPKNYLSYPKKPPNMVGIGKIQHIVIGLMSFSICWVAAYFVGTPGLAFRGRCALIGLRLLIRNLDFTRAYKLIVKPMDSVRYFEFDFIWGAVKDMKINSYLDISSPRLFPLMLIDANQDLRATLINPDKKDLPITVSLAKSMGLAERCRFNSDLIGDAFLEPNSFDLITSISVIEHILDDKEAIQRMWDLLKPGGRLLISVPCAAIASEEYTNRNDYELINQDESGFVFWQRYYNENLLRQRIYSVTGEPLRSGIYSEKQAGNYEKNVMRKRTDQYYPYYQEPYITGLRYQRRDSISELPGMGVIAMEFIKGG